jgi:hypothetical protein
MTDEPFVWTDVRDNAIREFGDAPSAELESKLIERFQREPLLVCRAIDTVILGVRDKTVRTPWAIVDFQTKAAISKLAEKTSADHRTKAVERAERWARNMGWQYPYTAYEDELFGRRGKLRRYRSEFGLRERMRELWQELQPADEPAPTTSEVPA